MRVSWRNIPAHELIIRFLQLKGGSVVDKDLYDVVSTETDMSYPEFLKNLMKLELNGLVRVSSIKEDTLLVELVKEKADGSWG